MGFRRRFRGRRPFRRVARAQRPTWQRAFDLAFPGDISDSTRSPFSRLSIAPDVADFLDLSLQQTAGGRRFYVTGANTAAPSAIQVVGRTELDFYEGELSVLRLMGKLCLFAVYAENNAGGQYNNALVEVRAWMYKTWEQDINSKIGAVNPFNVGDFDSRIVWSTSWFHNIVSGAPPTPTQGLGHLETGYVSPAATFLLERGTVSAYTSPAQSRSIRVKQAIKLKGNERLSLAVAVGPLVEETNIITVFMGGYCRMLVRH